MGPSPHEIGGFDRDGVQLNRLRARQGFTGLGPREEKEFIHPPAHLLRGQIHAIQSRAERLRTPGTIDRQVALAPDQGQRSAKLVGGLGEKFPGLPL